MDEDYITTAEAMGRLNVSFRTFKRLVETWGLTMHGGGRGQQAYYRISEIEYLKEQLKAEKFAVAK